MMNETESPRPDTHTVEAEVVVVEKDDESRGERHHQTHPHIVHIYSEIDKRDHTFRVNERTLVRHVMDCFYRSAEIAQGECDSFTCEANGEDLTLLREDSIAELRARGHCAQMVWIFSDRAVITVQVNNRPVKFEQREATGLEIKTVAITQGVAIQPDFCLFLVREGRQEPIRDDERVRLRCGQDFDAVDPDHCS